MKNNIMGVRTPKTMSHYAERLVIAIAAAFTLCATACTSVADESVRSEAADLSVSIEGIESSAEEGGNEGADSSSDPVSLKLVDLGKLSFEVPSDCTEEKGDTITYESAGHPGLKVTYTEGEYSDEGSIGQNIRAISQKANTIADVWCVLDEDEMLTTVMLDDTKPVYCYDALIGIPDFSVHYFRFFFYDDGYGILHVYGPSSDAEALGEIADSYSVRDVPCDEVTVYGYYYGLSEEDRKAFDDALAARLSSQKGAGEDGAKSSSAGQGGSVKGSGAASSDSNVTRSQQNALAQAKRYLELMPFSHKGLVEQLEYEGYSTSDAEYAADNCGADWYEQAALKAQDYEDLKPFSHQGLVEQLEYEGFTHSEAEHGVSAIGL